MVRPSVRRTAKYDVKISSDEVAKRYEVMKPIMIEQINTVYPELVAIEEKAKAILDQAGVSVIKIPFYLSWVREVYKVVKTHPGTTAVDEATALLGKWVGRGLDAATCRTLVKDIFGIVIPSGGG